MKIYTSYYGNAKKLRDANIQIIGISQGKPSFVDCPFINQLAPTRAMRSMSKSNYEVAYKQHLSLLNFDDIMQQIKLLSNGRDVALCCYESLKTPNDWCHRTMLADFFNQRKKQYNIQITEFQTEKQIIQQLSLL